MADETSKFGFDVSAALAGLQKLKKEMDSNAAAMHNLASGAKEFNAEGAHVEGVLKGVSTTLTLAAAQLRQYANANKEAAAASNQFLRTQQQTQAALGRGVVLTRPLAEKVKTVVANRPTFEDAVKINTAGSGTRQRNPAFDAEQQLRNVFRTPIQGKVVLNDAEVIAKSKRIELSWGSVIKVFGTQFAYRAVGSIVGAYTQAIDAAREYELKLAEIQTLSEEFAHAGLDVVGNAVSKLSAEFGQPIEGVAKGLYETLSNQIGNAAESTRFLGEALSFSRASLTSTADSVDLLSGVINSYGFTAASTADISDKLFRTIDLGRVRGEELSNTIGRILPLSAALGVSFEEVAASLAHLTIQGVKASDAQTQITNVMLKLIRPTQALKAEFQDLGIATPEAAIAAFGFQGALEKLTESGGTSAQEIGKLFNQIRGTRGVIGLVATDAAKYKDTLDQIKTGSAGAAEAAANLIQGTDAGKLTKELTAARNFLVNDFGRSAVDTFAKIITAIGGGERAMQILGAVATTAAVATLVFFGNASRALFVYTTNALLAQGATAGLAARMAALSFPVALLVAIPLAIAYFGQASTATDELKAKIDVLTDDYDKLSKAQLKAIQPQVDAQKKYLGEQTAEVERYFFTLETLYQKDKAAALKAQTEISRDLQNQLKERESDLDNFVNMLQEIQDRPAKTRKDLGNELLQSEFKVNSGKFERALNAQQDPLVQGRLLAQRSQKVLDAAKDAIGKGNVDFGKQLIDDAMGLANRSANITQTRFIGERQINNVLDTQKQLYGEIVQQQLSQANAAKKVETEQRANVDAAKTLINEYNDLNTKIQDQQLKPGTDTNKQQLDNLIAQRKQVAADLDKTLKSVSTANIPAVQALADVQRRLATPFTSPVNGKPTTLSIATDQSSQKVISLLTQWQKGIDVDLRLHVQGLTGQTRQDLAIEGTQKAQQETAKLNTDMQKLAENQKEGVTAANDYALGQEKIAEALKAMRAQAVSVAQGEHNLFGFNVNAVNPAEILTKPVTFNARETALRQREAQLKSIEADVRSSLGTGQTEDIKTRLNVGIKTAAADTGLADTLSGGHNAAALVQLQKLLEGIEQVEQASAKVKNVGNNLNSLNQGTAQLEGLNAATQGAAASSVLFVDSVNQVGSAARAQISGIEALTKAQLDNAAAGAAAVAPAHKAFGGMVHYFDMGGMARGSDVYPAMLGGDEMVMNGRASRQFYSQLVAMNSGASPAYRSEGGQVSFGDVNVNVTNNNSSPVNGRQIATELRRELRRNASFVY